jgi:hypothetical protein
VSNTTKVVSRLSEMPALLVAAPLVMYAISAFTILKSKCTAAAAPNPVVDTTHHNIIDKRGITLATNSSTRTPSPATSIGTNLARDRLGMFKNEAKNLTSIPTRTR